ncbi:bifunctional tRNA (mnm(5)s(2)U34)-methyltransferase/FAD-dependent cmnm(5)s(2)U34 oxidoreductase [Mariprofundus micogutta]|uniref:Bifunctional tRNA (Mnm(5)s(2)U34)-methyltransferase/FAD-dependent cmnm(5)s(2)U34 oxidoreductase n=2 Tax=Mariprofundus micogutta TaxID=1921010 RepID=A0A1L8CKL8_9PROT|nr:bifunctional tRNA (mnm(5)s(2)U34)-methyltransferase/FAD-dependent cmnm(5)s(2)U34 oxidoreductase [Mariprofundus micogutta]
MLIVGQGLAGSILAWQLIQCGKSVLVTHDEHASSASRVAAGLFNPVTGQRFVLQSDAEVLIPAARELYTHMEQQFEQPFFYEMPMLRIIKNEKELSTLYKRKTDPVYSAYLGEITTHPSLNAPLGVVEQFQTGYLDTNALLDCLKSYFIENHSFISNQFIHDDLETTAAGICWNGIKANQIIFCEGYMGRNNPWFSWLPFQPAKGEILTLKSTAELPDQIINGGRWLLPVHDGNHKVGATYDHDLSTTRPTEKAEHGLLGAMQQLLIDMPDYEIIAQQCGVRPNTLDKNPFIGFHPEHHQLGIFNGFGSKGSMLIPYYADLFAQHLTDSAEIPARVDIARIQ